jgi:H+/Cl- antiporter ClcA
MVLLEEWNNGAVFILLAIIISIFGIVFLSLLGILRLFPSIKNYMDAKKKQNSWLYYLALVVLFILFFFISNSIFNKLSSPG